jgi:hypothetical protein
VINGAPCILQFKSSVPDVMIVWLGSNELEHTQFLEAYHHLLLTGVMLCTTYSPWQV